MNSITKDDLRRISKQLDNFYTAYISYIYYSLICGEDVEQKNASEFIKFQKYLLQFSMIVNWCEVFGANAQNNHWKEITTENQEFTKLLYERGDYNYSSWYSYRKYIEEIKKSYLSSLDIYHHEEHKIDLKGIGVSLEVTHCWLNSLAKNSEDASIGDEFSRWPINNLLFNEEIEKEFHKFFK